ncbi:hypothetical protein [Cellulophaga omnivescoria]|uniref:hypothetical protein n=1 Tax=Cellulophaga omnivescoria TaxID=1888890 RepID=UPI00098594F4|nr:hypothetical protein [Cellulophaga omnivescoria]
MNKDKQIYGVDISKDVYDVCTPEGDLYQFKNSASGFKSFANILSNKAHCVMEAKGNSQYKLA